MARKKPAEPKKYMIKNVHSGPVHVKDLRKALSPGKEHPFEGSLSAGVHRLHEQGLLLVTELGPSDMKAGTVGEQILEKRESDKKKEAALTAKVRGKLDVLPRKESKGSAEALTADADLDAPPTMSDEDMESAILSREAADETEASARKKSKKGQ